MVIAEPNQLIRFSTSILGTWNSWWYMGIHSTFLQSARPGSKSGFAGGPAAVWMPMDGQKWDVYSHRDSWEWYIYLYELIDFHENDEGKYTRHGSYAYLFISRYAIRMCSYQYFLVKIHLLQHMGVEPKIGVFTPQNGWWK